MAHRPFGTIEERAPGRFRARYLGPDGKRHSAPTTFRTKADARGWLATEEAKIIEGRLKPSAATGDGWRTTAAVPIHGWVNLFDTPGGILGEQCAALLVQTDGDQTKVVAASQHLGEFIPATAVDGFIETVPLTSENAFPQKPAQA